MNDVGHASMRIGEVADKAAVNVQTLRYYERTGLLPKANRRSSGYREYAAETVALVRFIKNAQELGFTLRDISELIALRTDATKNRRQVSKLASRKIEDVERRIRALTAMRKTLSALVTACEKGRSGQPCPIIEALDDEQD